MCISLLPVCVSARAPRLHDSRSASTARALCVCRVCTGAPSGRVGGTPTVSVMELWSASSRRIDGDGRALRSSCSAVRRRPYVLRRLLEERAQDGARAVVVRGGPGIGKTALWRWGIGVAQRRWVHVCSSRAASRSRCRSRSARSSTCSRRRSARSADELPCAASTGARGRARVGGAAGAGRRSR